MKTMCMLENAYDIHKFTSVCTVISLNFLEFLFGFLFFLNCIKGSKNKEHKSSQIVVRLQAVKQQLYSTLLDLICHLFRKLFLSSIPISAAECFDKFNRR